jgi:glycosyltransferase involved in cell wall biosynthesis
LRILFVLQEFPYPVSNGIRWKPFGLLKALSSEHECHVLSFADTSSESAVEDFRKECPKVKVLGIYRPRGGSLLTKLRGLFAVGLPSAGPYSTDGFRNAIRLALTASKYDVVHIDMINLVQYANSATNCSVLLSVNDAISLGYLNTARHSSSPLVWARLRLAAKIISRYERRAYRGRVVHVVSPADRNYLKQLCPSAQVEVVPLTVDSSYLRDNCYTGGEGPKIVTVPAKFVLPGAAKATLRFLREAQELLREKRSSVELRVIGPGASLAFRQSLTGLTNVKYLGWVEDYSKALALSDVIVFPETGGAGTKNRHLQAMALSKPVIMTQEAIDGLGVVPGKHCLVGQTPEQLVECLAFVLDDYPRAAAIGRMGRAFVEEHHNVHTVAREWGTLYESLRARSPLSALSIRTTH